MLDNQINQTTATLRLKALVAEPERAAVAERVRQGAHAGRDRARTRSSIPTVAVQHGPQGTFVYVVGADKTAQMKPVDGRAHAPASRA